MKAKTPSDSLTIVTEIVLPNDTNNLKNLFGGRLLSWMDRASAIAAHRHCKRIVVTSSVNNVSFNQPIPQGSIVTLEARVSRAFTSSMEVFVDVYIEDQTVAGKKVRANEAIYTFVAVDQLGNPINVPALIPETELEKKRYEGALRRRQLALILSGKMKPSEASELKALFFSPEEIANLENHENKGNDKA
ncbi:MAG TPA: acyl-CoA thioesterase [Cryomorphaceae bacterium]|nr:acyl-CoA thioesterase [Owenweeksia sp.]MBF98606.1 acyl-CoA thioesterase [Owenweeksia sp.]HAD97712.1 acyl-CoA thioesterase [Cryomorphaceae bacterium]HBF20197.1 acyl-CoA thioesterase [Cryomorphaceae bacterium]HCQ17195.1 acyl-CoA thioesterase [Cryomorphaceae bacterium]|tara:strand:- start:4697 stop:5266 length:570 start_codon:yes stop_codon:yes gene_type:complete